MSVVEFERLWRKEKCSKFWLSVVETGGSQEQKSIKVIEKNVDPKTKEDFFEPNVKSVLTMSSPKEVQNTDEMAQNSRVYSL